MIKKLLARIITISSVLCICLSMSGCGNTAEEPVQEKKEVPATENLSPISSTENSNVDLTVLSSTAVYGEVYDMMCYPEKYVGKTVKMEGLYSEYLDAATKKQYYACIIMDATACCSQGIEFILTDNYNYPDDYPKEGDYITVEGTFDTYEEESGMYCTLKDASLLIGD